MPFCYDTTSEDIEFRFMTKIARLAEEHGCKLIDCNFWTKYIEIDCPDSADRVRLAQKIDEEFAQWRYENGKSRKNHSIN